MKTLSIATLLATFFLSLPASAVLGEFTGPLVIICSEHPTICLGDDHELLASDEQAVFFETADLPEEDIIEIDISPDLLDTEDDSKSS